MEYPNGGRQMVYLKLAFQTANARYFWDLILIFLAFRGHCRPIIVKAMDWNSKLSLNHTFFYLFPFSWMMIEMLSVCYLFSIDLLNDDNVIVELGYHAE